MATSESSPCQLSKLHLYVSVRLSGRSSVLQVQRGGVWRTVCSEGWNNWLGVSACRQLGYSRCSSVLQFILSESSDLSESCSDAF